MFYEHNLAHMKSLSEELIDHVGNFKVTAEKLVIKIVDKLH